MYIDAGKIRMHISPAFAVFLALCTNIFEGRIYLLSFVCVFFHELTHIAFLFYFGCERAFMDFYPGGIRLSAIGFSSLSYGKTVLCTLSAPVVNIVSGLLCLVLKEYCFYEVFIDLFYINIMMGSMNLLPMPFLDGGRALQAFLLKITHSHKAFRICDILTVISLFVIGGIFFVSLISGKNYVSLMFFFVYCTLGCIKEKRCSAVT